MPWETTGGGGIGLMNQTDFESYIEDQSNSEGVANSPIAMGSIISSKPAMDAVAASQTAMDAVSASQTAMDSVAASQTAMDSVAASQTAMDSVAASQTAMDSVAASQTARDVVNESQLAFDTVSASNMAIGKFVAGLVSLTPTDYADMDAVAASQTAMGAVAASQTAMDAVSESAVALAAAFESDYAINSIWSEAPSEEIWLNGNPTPPASLSDGGLEVDLSTVAGRSGNGVALKVYGDGSTGGPIGLDLTVDLSNYSNLSLYTKTPSGDYVSMTVVIGGSTVYKSQADDQSSNWTNRVFDVSGYNGNTTVQLGAEAEFSTSYQGTFHFSDIELS